MRTILATLAVAIPILTIAAPPAEAAPAEVNVRIEGRTETLFEGPILADGRNVRASSDAKAPPSGRRCNGLNNNQNPVPGPTPTGASAGAMSILGEDFDGQWYAEPFEDYFIERWGPDGQDEGKGEYWGLIVNNVFTSVGGCQYQLDAGDEVVWAYDAFAGRPRLGLYPAGYTAGAVPLTASIELGQAFEVEVDSWGGYNEGAPPPSPQRTGAEPFNGAEVAPVVPGAGGFEAIDSEDPATAVTGGDGLAEVEFDEPGWHRIKATVVAAGGESAIRSNRLDVCVFESLPGECPPVPADDLVRTPPPAPAGEGEPGGPGSPAAAGGGAAPAPAPAASAAAAGPVRLRLSRPNRNRIGQGLVGVSWSVLDDGPGVARWAISSLALGRKGARYVSRASGSSGSSATLRLPRGAAYRLQLTITDALGRGSTTAIGRVRVPR